MPVVATRARVDAELVRRGLARSREQAVVLIDAGRVSAGGRVVAKPSQRVDPDTDLTVEADLADPGFASRAGHKLAGALSAFRPAGLTIEGRRCLDVGASTGGFTDVLLRAGADVVVCLDVGHDQLVPRLRADPRTVVLEGRNVREATAEDIGGRAGLVVADVSFISLVLVLPVLTGLAMQDADLVLLVKPQFEVGRERLGSGGVVRELALHREAVRQVVTAADGLGWGVHGVARSVLPGPAGNVEYFLWLRRGPGTVGADAVDRAVTAGVSGEKVSS
jgi:23S rRNA (cytidine1920-2'-O)/16S rRNA (cytidine1409-2'-O)-methyltransferase